ncbi:ATP-dependent DNA helicase [Neolewinella agarilytica]|uniref:UvrD-like helicase C-terminal domain-containing protein n=1 Tax=Neolewinella agarilytica TaxID=478744 RepID=A0A1H8Z8P1_9BACT|nr:AAA family ATPase [Neolewinella agarilytica]SEP60804.1 UvrD-like helicase C-terminal domain-containing protein [Neolewinella agarilytica]
MSSLQLTPHQQQIFTRLQAFVAGNDHQVFLLKGYAGTGKTTLVSFLLRHLEASKAGVTPVLMASTGRAAKVLSRKTGVAATTVHSYIYRFEGVDDGQAAEDEDYDEKTGQLMLTFELREPEQDAKDNYLFIIDEASMLSHLEGSGESATRFGSGSMLADFFHFVGKHKVLFIGDPVQLPPPVGKEPFSSALDAEFLRVTYGLGVTEQELRHVIRQKKDNPVLALATELRGYVDRGETRKNWQPVLKKPDSPFFTPYTQALMADRYLAATKDDFAAALIITHSNKQTHYLNNIVRAKRYPPKQLHRLQRNELLQVVQNNHLVPLANGDQILVRDARPLGKSGGFFFLTIKAEDVNTGEVHEVPLLYDFLFDQRANFSGEDFRKLLVDFDKRARKKGLRRKSEAYLNAMQNDQYLNALRAKFGYAVTCHKAQGGEWDTVFLNLSETINMLPPESRYRWLYTAVTRASKQLELKHIWKGSKPVRKVKMR